MPVRYVAIAALSLAIMVIGHDHIHRNVSDSLPVSWFWVWQDYTVARGDLVEFCPPMGFDSEAHTRGYVRNGPCPGGTIPFLKMVAAVAGDDVEFDAQGVHVNGRSLANSKAKRADRAGRPLASQPFGGRKIPAGYVWLYGTNVWSADSRYYGPVPVNTIRYRARPLIASALPDLR
jgi:conjugative transfer signal peptidase TraF